VSRTNDTLAFRNACTAGGLIDLTLHVNHEAGNKASGIITPSAGASERHRAGGRASGILSATLDQDALEDCQSPDHPWSRPQTCAEPGREGGGNGSGAFAKGTRLTAARQAQSVAFGDGVSEGGGNMYESKRSFTGGAVGRVRKLVPNWHVGKFPSSTSLDDLVLRFRTKTFPR
jgi:hypothetical protein